VVCLVLLCVLLLTAVIVLCVHIYTKNTNCTQETKQLLTNDTNLTEERDELIIKNANLLNKTVQLINQLSILVNFSTRRYRWVRVNGNNYLTLLFTDEWIYYQFSFYYMSNKTKNWTESRQDCKKKGADLIIINNREEQDFVTKITDKRDFWIGVTDSDEEGNWKWVDGSTLTTGFWASKEPNGKRGENCAVTYLTEWPELIGWHDVKCNDAFRLICEKSIFPLIQREIS
uniref:C-type lectin domain-containing protein n=1 Tax=Sinocyclocheilus rhinocerous TaxID=307959 RepID=A0A673KEY8_9TELE